jgi:hypothetical protein
MPKCRLKFAIFGSDMNTAALALAWGDVYGVNI